MFEAHIGDTLFRFGEKIEPFPEFKNIQPMVYLVDQLPHEIFW